MKVPEFQRRPVIGLSGPEFRSEGGLPALQQPVRPCRGHQSEDVLDGRLEAGIHPDGTAEGPGGLDAMT